MVAGHLRKIRLPSESVASGAEASLFGALGGGAEARRSSSGIDELASRECLNISALAGGAERGSMSPVPNKSAVPVEAPKRGDFEKSLTRLEEVVKRLESADLSLDEAMRLFEEGVKLSRECQKQLEEAEGRVEILLKKADGKIVAELFDPEDENN